MIMNQYKTRLVHNGAAACPGTGSVQQEEEPTRKEITSILGNVSHSFLFAVQERDLLIMLDITFSKR